MRMFLLLVAMIAPRSCAMDNPDTLQIEVRPSLADIQSAYLRVAHERGVGTAQFKKNLSYQLFSLSLNWSDQFGVVGVTLAKTLIEKGADPFYPHIQEEFLENKQRKMIICFTQTAARVATGKLKHFFASWLHDDQEE